MEDATVLASNDHGGSTLLDLHEKYDRLMIRQNRLNRLLKLHAPEIVIRNEQRLIADAVKELFEDAEKFPRRDSVALSRTRDEPVTRS